MNAERLHAVAKELLSAFNDTNEMPLLNQLHDSLQNQINQPQISTHQEQISATLKELYSNLENSTTNGFSPVWKQALDELGATHLIGLTLQEKIKEIFTRNQITPSVALKEIAVILRDAKTLVDALSEVVASFENLNIGAELLEPGNCELGFLIPRTSINNRLDEFSSELRILDKTFKTFSELATGSRPSFGIRTISSTDLSVFLDITPATCACIAVSIERIVALYKSLLEIRSLRQQISDKGISDKSLKGIDDHANNHMNKGISEIIADLTKQYAAVHNKGRLNELQAELRHALNGIANRIDKGYNFEVRVAQYKDTEIEEDNETNNEKKALHIAMEAAKKLQFLKPSGSTILKLPEPDNEQNGK